MRFGIVVIMALGFISGSIPSHAGWGVGNPGGDNLGIIFTQAKQHAAKITAKVHAEALKRVTDARTADWILTHKEKLAGDILASPHRRNEEEHRTCAHTYFPEVGELGQLPVAKPIELFFPTCRQTITTFEDAAALLIHESVHHFNIASESFADKVAVAITTAWKSGYVEWGTVKPSEAVAHHSAVWTGSEMLIFGGTDRNGNDLDTLKSYNPETGVWRTLSSKKAPAVHKHAAFYDRKRQQMLVWGGYKRQGRSIVWQNSGAIYDLEKDKWKELKSPFGNDTVYLEYTRFQPVQPAAYSGDELIFYGAEMESGIAGATYNFDTKKWTAIPTFSGANHTSGHSVVYTGSGIVVWGGIDRNNNPAAVGGHFNLATGTWQKLSSQGAPDATNGHTAVWTGEKMAVFGGFERGVDFTGKGGVYNPATDTWEAFETQLALMREFHTAVWTGKEVLIYGGRPNRTRMHLGTVAALDPTTLKWRAISSKSQPEGRIGHSAVWTGSQMIIFGGTLERGRTADDGGIFYP